MKLFFLAFALALSSCATNPQVSSITSSKTEQPLPFGVEVRFKIFRETTLFNGSIDRKTYENAMLMAFDELGVANFEQLFKIKLIAKDKGLTANVNVTLFDNMLDGVLIGSGSVDVPFEGETLLQLPSSNGNKYLVLLKAVKRALPATTKS